MNDNVCEAVKEKGHVLCSNANLSFSPSCVIFTKITSASIRKKYTFFLIRLF